MLAQEVAFGSNSSYDMCVLKYYGFPLVKSVLHVF